MYRSVPIANLLPRFAACADRLAGTGAPGLYEWCNLSAVSGYCIHGEGIVWDIREQKLVTEDSCVVNHAACLAGCVMWAMKVDSWAVCNKVLGNAVVAQQGGGYGVWPKVYNPDASFLQDSWVDQNHKQEYRDTLEEIWLFVLESICDAIGESK